MDEEQLRPLEEEIQILDENIRSRNKKVEDVEREIALTSDLEERKRLQQEKTSLQHQQTLLMQQRADRRECDVKNGKPLGVDHSLSKFVACLRDQRLQEVIMNAQVGSLIELPEEVVWLGDQSIFTNQLYVRPCYLELLEAKERHFELRDLNVVVYTRTPWIGKSHLCALVIAQKLIASITVYFEKLKDGRQRYFKLELEGGVRRLEPLGVLHLVKKTATAVYMVDGGSSDWASPLECQVFASPSKSLYTAKRKVWPCLYLLTPLFDLEEMCKCSADVSAFHVDIEATVEAWFSVVGGVARTMLKVASQGLS